MRVNLRFTELVGVRAGVVALMAVVAVCSPGLAAEQKKGNESDNGLTAEQRREAKEYFLLGSERFADKKYTEAIGYFRQAYQITRSPEIIYNIGRCHEELRQVDEAVASYEKYLLYYPNADDVDEVKHRITMLGATAGVKADAAASRTDPDAQAEPRAEAQAEPRAEAQAEPQAEEPPEPPGESTAGPWGLGAHIGGAATVTGPTDSPCATAGLNGSFAVGSWLSVFIMGSYGKYFNNYEYFDTRMYLAAVGGVRGLWDIVGSLGVTASLGVGYTWIEIRGGALHWLMGSGTGGVVYKFTEHWRLFGEFTGAFGIVIGDKDSQSEKLADPDPQTEIGGRITGEYRF